MARRSTDWNKGLAEVIRAMGVKAFAAVERSLAAHRLLDAHQPRYKRTDNGYSSQRQWPGVLTPCWFNTAGGPLSHDVPDAKAQHQPSHRTEDLASCVGKEMVGRRRRREHQQGGCHCGSDDWKPQPRFSS